MSAMFCVGHRNQAQTEATLLEGVAAHTRATQRVDDMALAQIALDIDRERMQSAEGKAIPSLAYYQPNVKKRVGELCSGWTEQFPKPLIMRVRFI